MTSVAHSDRSTTSLVSLTESVIDEAQVRSSLTDESAGAIVLFVGTTRRWTRGRETLWLEYQAHPALALAELHRLRESALARWNLSGCILRHRLGPVEIGAASVVVGVSSPHRRQAFAAAEWLMEAIKRSVPIWKREHWSDGESAWLHPGPAAEAMDPGQPPSMTQQPLVHGEQEDTPAP